MALSSVNLTSPAPASLGKDAFTLQAPAGCDTWRTPPSTDRFSAPIVYVGARQGSFRRARVTATAGWRAMYDQAGLVVVKPSSTIATGSNPPTPHWIKAGLEVVDGVRHASVVRAEPYSDWSLTPLVDPAALAERGSVTVEFERVVKEGKPSPAMWVYLIRNDGSRQKLREVTSIFDEKDEDKEIWVGVYTAQPIGTDTKEPLEVEFKDFELETA